MKTEKENRLRINYHIELINDKKTWDKLIRITENYTKYHIEPWELYTQKDFNNFEDAITYYMTWFVSDECYDIKMWEQIFIDNEMVYEEYLEPKSTIMHYMKDMINKDLNNNCRKLIRENEDLKSYAELTNGFIKSMGVLFEKKFKEYQKCMKEC